jgi:ATP-dependent helicase HrpA
MNDQNPKALLAAVKGSLDKLLLTDRSHLNALMRRIRLRIHDRKPVDQQLSRLQEAHQQALKRAESRKQTPLTLTYPKELPVSGRKEEILRAIQDHQVIIVCGTTGSGKTTQLPKMAREAGLGSVGRIGVTQPRRLAATGMARRVAEEMDSAYGKGVGCQVRFDNCTCDETVIKFMTDGILLAETQQDRHLLQYDCLIIDEAHERSLNIDFILGYLKTLLKIRPDLKIIISSATLDAASFSTFFNDAPVIEVEGRTYPVEDFFLPPGPDEELSNHILRAVRWINDVDAEGDILIFLPGEREIRDATDKLAGQHFKQTEVLPLYGRLSISDQQRVFKPNSMRRIILSTNVAETSITIPRIHYVIDSGLVRLSRYNPRTQVQGLQIEQISQASARQRRGRCGRVTDGICLYLYSEETFQNSASFTDPEIRRTSLAGVILQMDLLDLPPIDQFPLIDPPQAALINEGYKTLYDIGAIDTSRKLTPLGKEIAAYPIDPHLARMIVQAQKEGALPELHILTAFLSIQDVRERPADKAEAADLAHKQWVDPSSDFVTILNLWNALEELRLQSHGKLRKFCKQNYLNFRRIIEWWNLWSDIRQIGNRAEKKGAPQPAATELYDAIHRSLLAGLPANIGVLGENREYQAARNRKFFIFPGSGLFKKPPQWILTFSLVETAKLYARIVAKIDPAWLETVAPHLCKATYEQPQWNPDAGFVYAKESIVSGGLVLLKGRRVHLGPIDPPLARQLFIKEGMAPGNLKTRNGWLALHLRMLDDIASMEEKMRRPGALLDMEAVIQHFDRLLPDDVYSVKSLENWLHKSKARIAMRIEEALFHQSTPFSPADYPDSLSFDGHTFTLLYSFEPGDELDGIALVCPREKLIFLPDWAPDWLVPGWLPEKVERLLRSLPKNLRTRCGSIEGLVRGFLEHLNDYPPSQPLLSALSRYLQQDFGLPVDEADFDDSVLPEFLRMKVIETQNDEIIQIHADLSKEHRHLAHRSSTQLAFSKWDLPPKQTWPGDALPDFVVSNDSKQLRGYPALTASAQGVGRSVFLDPETARAKHREGLVQLFRIQEKQQVRYIEKRPPFSPTQQLTLAAIDSGFLSDFFDLAIYNALTHDETIPIRDAATFASRAIEARANLYEHAEELAGCLIEMIDMRERIIDALEAVPDEDSKLDIELQLAFLFRPGFLRTAEVESRYARYLKAIQMRLQRLRHNPQADQRKMLEIVPFQDQLNDQLLACDDIASAYPLIHYAMLVEEFRVNRFAPEIKTPAKISAQRLEEAWSQLMLNANQHT